MGGALGLAALAAAYTAIVAGPNPAALNSGYHAAFLAGAGCVLLGILIAATSLRGLRPGEAAVSEVPTEIPDHRPDHHRY